MQHGAKKSTHNYLLHEYQNYGFVKVPYIFLNVLFELRYANNYNQLLFY